MRVAGKGLLQGAAPVHFTFDGVNYAGVEGDTVASALLANDVRLMGRSFKYHRPRGVLTAGSEEPNALVTVDGSPNTRATVQDIYGGLAVQSQNAWPSLDLDAMAINDLISPFLGAGFYYKTFMWPKSFWEKLYEPIIRRAAGLGALSGRDCRDRYEKAFAFCDVLVIGGGPAGLMAALTAARAGQDVIVCDEAPRLGGRLLAEDEDVAGQPAAIWVDQVSAELLAMDNVRIMSRTTVTGAYDQGTYGALEEVSGHRPSSDTPRACFWRIAAKHAVLCAGALERPIAFPNNDRPGIMMAGAVRAYLNRWGVAAGKRLTVFGNNDDAHRTARDFVNAGIDVAGVVDTRAHVQALADYPVFHRAEVVNTKGRMGLRSIAVRHAGGTTQLQTDCLAMSSGWNPTVHLTCHMNARPQWSDTIASFVPIAGSIPGLVTAGSCNGAMTTASCLDEGTKVTAKALGIQPIPVPDADRTPYAITPHWMVEGKGRKWLDFQNDVHVKDVRLAAQENYASVEHMKRYTTQGMATDQGKSSNVSALAVLADATGRGIPETGTTTFRPPYVPVPIAAMGAGGWGKGFAPQRLTTSHAQTVALGAPMIEAGLWYRPSYFPRPGEATWRDSCDREVAMVRSCVGICDVSTLGKIDVQGPDAAAFLDFVYINTLSTLKVGKVRYGLMLREDGFVMDDGTAARMSEGHYVITTTTAAAGQVMTHLEFVLQVLRPDWDVRICSATEQWAQFAVAGPQSRDLLNEVLDQPIGDETLPYMAHQPIQIGGVAGRLFRISFSGEHAYEIAVPARFGASLFAQLLDWAEAMGGGAYGMEALNVMRIEKGFITHAEIHGRVTAFDIGMDRMISRKKDCIGQTAAARPGLIAEDREQLVGLKAVDPEQKFEGGAHLFNKGANPVRINDHGYVTSMCYSPTLRGYIGLGFLKRGRDRIGETLTAVDHVRGASVDVEVCDHVFLDREGERLRG